MIGKILIPGFLKILMVLMVTAMSFSTILLSTQAVAYTEGSRFLAKKNPQKSENVVMVRLIGATDYELVDVFGKVLNKAQGVSEAKRHGSRIVPDNPRSCFAVWKVRIHEPDLSRVQSSIIQAIRHSGVDLLKGIRAGSVSSGEIQFIVP